MDILSKILNSVLGQHLLRFTQYKMYKGKKTNLSVAISVNRYTVSNLNSVSDNTFSDLPTIKYKRVKNLIYQ